MSNKMNGIPTPGSELAIEQGCTCAVIDNHYGRGIPHGSDENGHQRLDFWVSDDCPIHGRDGTVWHELYKKNSNDN